MENKSNYEKIIEILKDNINRILNEKDQSMRWLSIKIGNNERHIARLLRGELVPSLQVICKIAEVLRVSVADLFTKKRGVKKLWDLSGPTLPRPIAMGKFTCYTGYTNILVMKEELK